MLQTAELAQSSLQDRRRQAAQLIVTVIPDDESKLPRRLEVENVSGLPFFYVFVEIFSLDAAGVCRLGSELDVAAGGLLGHGRA